MLFPESIPTLSTNRLILRPLEPSDAPRLFHNFSDDSVTEFYDLYTFQSMDEAEKLAQTWINRTDQKEGLRWAITFANQPDFLLGTCGYHNLSLENNRAEIGYELDPNYWGQGIMTEAVQCLVDFGFKTMQLRRIEAFIDPKNHASRALLNKCRLKTEGVLRDYFFEKERFVDAELLSVLNPTR